MTVRSSRSMLFAFGRFANSGATVVLVMPRFARMKLAVVLGLLMGADSAKTESIKVTAKCFTTAPRPVRFAELPQY